MTESKAGAAALQELHIGGSRHLRSAQASQIHTHSAPSPTYYMRSDLFRAMHKLGHYARIPAAMCPRNPRMWRIEGMNAEHNEIVGQQVQT